MSTGDAKAGKDSQTLLQDLRIVYRLLTPRQVRMLLLLMPAILAGTVIEMASLAAVYPLIFMVLDPDQLPQIPVVGAMLADWNLAEDTRSAWIAVAGAVVGLFVLRFIALGGLYYVTPRIIMAIRTELATRLLRLYLRAPHSMMSTRNSMHCIHHVNAKSNEICVGVLDPFVRLVTHMVFLIGIVAMLAIVQPLLFGGVVLLFGISGALLYALLMPRMVGLGKRVREESEAAMYWIQQSLGSVRETKLLEREAHFADSYHGSAERFARAVSLRQFIDAMPRPLLEMIVMIAGVIGLIYGFAEGIDLVAMIPVLGVFALATLRAMPLVNQALTQISKLRFSHASVRVFSGEIDEMQAAIASSKQTDDGTTLPFEREIALTGVDFAYVADKPILTDISVRVKKGETHAFVGQSGAGKSTLIDLMAGFLQPDAGKVTVDGTNIAEIIASWQRNIAYIQQDTFLLDDTFKRNITFGLDDADTHEAQLQDAIEKAHLTDVVAGLPDGLDSRIGERGVLLSGGQRQRIGIARALYHKRPVLIMDEATAQLDAGTETRITQSIQDLHGEKTIIIIAHRLSTVQHADCIHFMTAEGIADSGTFGELYARNDDFRTMVEQMQLETGDLQEDAGKALSPATP